MATPQFRIARQSRIARLALVLALSAAPLAVRAEISELPLNARPSTLSGSYLAGRSADTANDVDAALAYLTFTLSEDPGNALLSERVLMLRLSAGEVDQAVDLADKLVISDPHNPTARLALAAAAIKKGQYDLAKSELEESANSPLAVLTAGLMKAWAEQGEGKTNEALATIRELSGPGWYDIFKNYHTALIADAAGRLSEADEAISRSYGDQTSALRIVEAYVRIKNRNGKKDEAEKALSAFLANAPDHPVIKRLQAELQGGTTPGPIAETAATGGAEVLYGLGSAIGTDEGMMLATAYLQIAHYLDPKLDQIVLALGDLFNAAGQYDKAISIYRRVGESSPVWRNAAIQTANCLDKTGKTEEGAALIRKVIAADPSDTEAAIALGNLYRGHDRFADAADAFTVGVNSITDESPADWRVYYFRGIAYERTQRWPQAEADFNKALSLNPDQPQVLNYLGYSWVDMGLNLDKAMDMIRTAVELRPDDGYIVDSLGWAYYRLGQYDNALTELEQAIALRPEDPTINDHLGDVYWKVGRKREAVFQWQHARDLKPDEKDLPKILAKIQHGLVDEPAPVKQEAPKEDGPGASAAPTEPPAQVAAVSPAEPAEAPAPSSVTVELGDTLARLAKRFYGDYDLYMPIFNANRDLIANPDLIIPGMTLKIPPRQ